MFITKQHLPTDMPPELPKGTGKEVDMLWGVKIPMRDGIKLNATVIKPHGQEKPLPVIFTFTPYISDSYYGYALTYAQRGYVYAMVDVRGRGNSEGHFYPFMNEGPDGHDVVEWFATQPYCDGQVTMWGGSYAGFDQWLPASHFPPHLKTIVPVASGCFGVDFPFPHNIKSSYLMQWLTFTSGVTGNANLFGSSEFWTAKYTEMYREHKPFKELDQIVGNTTTHFQDYVNHPLQDSYWDKTIPSDDFYRKVNLPILTITGHYDGDQMGAMTYYKKHMELGTEEAKANHYLVIGPWDHAGTRKPTKEVGGVTFGEASMLDMADLHVAWYDWVMKGGPKPEFLKKRVAYYVMGPEEWKYADSLESISNETRRLYLGSDGKANDVFQAGTLTDQPSGTAKADSYVYDPLDIRPGLELEQEPNPNYITDQTAVLNTYGNGVIYHSEPFTAATEITGYIKLNAWIEMDVPDTDLAATLYEILPDNRSILLTQDFIRARYRESLRQEKLVTPDEIYCYDFDSFTFFSRLISKGSRLRLLICSPNSIQLEKNYNSGGVVAEETAKDARTAHIKLYHDAEHPSVLELPVVK